MKLFSTFLVLIVWVLFFWTAFWWAPDDWLRDSYQYSHKPPTSDKPYTADIEADDMFNTNAALNIWWPNSWLWTSDSVLVRLARFLMRVWVMLWVPLLIFGWIKISLSFGDNWKLMESLKLLWYMVWWLVLILMSVMIVFLITSLTRSSLPLFLE